MAGNPVGIANVVRMEYEIAYGTFDLGPEAKLAWTDSFKEGITLSDIQWSFVNTSSQAANQSSSTISFTLHDIAGGLFEKFMHLKKGQKYLYFKGPQSSGPMWSGSYAIYRIDGPGCSLEFSQTQGFTYTFSGTSAVDVSKTAQSRAPEEIPMSNVLNPAGNWKSFLEVEFTKLWNKTINDSKKPTAEIAIIFDESDDANSKYASRVPIVNDTQFDGDHGSTFKFSVKKKETVFDAISRCWNTIFKKQTEDEGNKVRIRVDFWEWKGSVMKYRVYMTDKSVENALIPSMKVCIGSDDNCIDKSAYRAELSSINLADIVNSLLYDKKNSTGEAGATANPGADVKVMENENDERSFPIDNGVSSGNALKYQSNSLLHVEENDRTSFWGQLNHHLHSNFIADLELVVNMPYSSDFFPVSQGGKLITQNPGSVATISMKQGVDLEFFWYETPDCDKLVKSPVITGKYRLTQVDHQIGLGGNQTVLKLGHLKLTDG